MKIRLELYMRNELPEVLNRIAREHGKTGGFQENKPILFTRTVEWEAPPREGESVLVCEMAEPRSVLEVCWYLDGTVMILLDGLDADEIGEDEASALDILLETGWEVDLFWFE